MYSIYYREPCIDPAIFSYNDVQKNKCKLCATGGLIVHHPLATLAYLRSIEKRWEPGCGPIHMILCRQPHFPNGL